jgi:carbonic anhydrase
MDNRGQQQSPIWIDPDAAYYHNFCLEHLDFQYAGPRPGKFEDHNFVFADPYQGLSLKVSGNEWVLRKIHLHVPAEHQIKDQGTHLGEVHLLHARPGDDALRGPKHVVAVFIEVVAKHEGPEKPTIHALDASFEQHAGLHAHPQFLELDPREFLPASTDRFFHYEGSLTSPPFNEDVSWYVLSDVDSVPVEIFRNLLAQAQHSPRRVMPLNRRFVLKSFRPENL